MNTHQLHQHKIAEITAAEIVINDVSDALDLIGNLSYQGYDAVILQTRHLPPTFFDLKTRFAGEVLQKFATYRMRLAIVGDFSGYPGQPIRDFIYESNKGKQVNFLPGAAEALERLSQ